jgi:hypothetical protein
MLFDYRFAVIDIGKLIAAKRAAGRQKDLLALPELEAIQEALNSDRSPKNETGA